MQSSFISAEEKQKKAALVCSLLLERGCRLTEHWVSLLLERGCRLTTYAMEPSFKDIFLECKLAVKTVKHPSSHLIRERINSSHKFPKKPV